jgi:hypothetical protein
VAGWNLPDRSGGGRSSPYDVLLIDTAKATGKNIQGRERPARKLPTAYVPRQVSRWEEVGQYLEAQ